VSVFSPQQFADQLNRWYSSWEKSEVLLENRNESAIKFYSRENQAMLLADVISSL
jgi:hypothetical protein